MAADPSKHIAVIILAAGLGTRMKSEKAKVLHKLLGRPMISYVAETAKEIAGENIVLVVGYQSDEVRETVVREISARFALQEQQLGTGHAVLCALPFLPDDCDDVMILCGDVPLLTPQTARKLIADHQSAGRDLSVLVVDIDNPTGYGRILRDENGRFERIVEEADATDDQKTIRTINAGIYCAKKNFLADALQQVTTNNSPGEFYLTDIIEIGCAQKKVLGVMNGQDPQEVRGINSPEDLVAAENILRRRQSKIS